MKIKSFYILICLLFSQIGAFSSTILVSGKVIDAQTKEALPGAVVSIPDLRLSAVTNQNGEFAFRNTPEKGRLLIEVRFIGYKTLTQTVDFSASSVLEFALLPTILEAKEVIITGSAFSTDERTNSTSVTAVGKAQLINRPSTNLVDAISRVAGVSQVTTGAAVSKPVIRGLSYNRVLTLVNGTKQEGQQWGDEHGLEVDQYSAERVEVLRGAASLLYGSDALGGVINVIDPLPPTEGQIKGEFITNYASNNGLNGNSLMLGGNANGFIWRGRGTYKNGYSFNTPEGRIPNTGFNETSLSGQIGLNRKWGYTHLDVSSFRNNIGLPDFERNAAGEFEDADGHVFSSDQLRSRQLLLPYQDVRHYKVALNNNILTGVGRIRSNLSFQNNQRREMEESTVDPSLFFDLKTYSYDLKYYFQEKSGWEPAIGVAGAFQNSKNKAEELLIPDYNSTDIGFFGYAKKTWNNITTFNLGARFDYRTISGIEMEEGGNTKFSDFTNDFSNISGAIGFTHQLSDKLNFKANLGSAFRAPNIAELSSEGVHEGTFRYEIGNTGLKPEQSFYGDLSLDFENEKVSTGLSVFNNHINNYIFYRQSGNETQIVNGDVFPVFRYVQDNANLYGAEATLTLHPSNTFHFENSFSFTRGVNLATDSPLPFIPAAELRNELRIEPKAGKLTNNYFSIELDNVFRQKHIDIFETATSAYTLVNVSAGTTLLLGKQQVRINVAANNLFDKAYANHLSRLKYEGILNQGRNIAVGLYVPFNFK
jgi:iron complex outermembrane recepter protein